MKAVDVLESGGLLVAGPRAETHGDARKSFIAAAALWSAYLGHEIKPGDVPMMLALLKINRTKFGLRNEDDFIDGAAYIALASEVSE